MNALLWKCKVCFSEEWHWVKTKFSIIPVELRVASISAPIPILARGLLEMQTLSCGGCLAKMWPILALEICSAFIILGH